MEDVPRLHLLFAKYLQRSCSPEEVEELIGLLQHGKAEESLGGPMEALWQELKEEDGEYPIDWNKMYGVISQTEEDLVYLSQRRKNRVSRRSLQVAAAVLLLVLSSILYWAANRTTKTSQLLAVAEPKDVQAQQFPRKKQIIHLPDGSTVILNENSKLDYPLAFAGKTREVYLSGEGYFDIIHQVNRPFLVHTGKITTRVLGTAFNIRAYPNDEAIEVTVTRGKVQVEKENKNMGLLTANQQISFSKKTEEYVQKLVDTKPVVAWKPLEISFDDVTMQEATRQIGQRFKMEVEFVNPVIKDCRVTATFYEVDRLNEIMTVICGVSQSNFTIQNNKIIIDGKGCD